MAGSDDSIARQETVAATGASAAPPQRPATGQDAGDFDELAVVPPERYVVAGELARGGMGRILTARDRRLGRPVAIKELIARDDASRARFEREARITARLQHPNIVHVHEAGRWPSGEPFYAMKLIAGRPLDACVAAAATVGERLALVPNVIAVVDALAYAHCEGVIHRDLKPANVLCGEYGETVVIDWGLAKDLRGDADEPVSPGGRRRTPSSSGGDTVDGAVIGTPAYMPPEQARGERVDARADVYALGALLYQVLAGAPPYQGRSTADVLDRVLHERPPPLPAFTPLELRAIVDKAMARDPRERFPTAKEMAEELRRFQTGQLVASHHYTTWQLVRRWMRRHRTAVVAIATLVVAASGFVVWIARERARADVEAARARARADAALIEHAQAALATDPTLALVELLELSPGAPEWRHARVIAADAASRGVAQVLACDGAVGELAISPDGTRLLSAEPGMVRLWDLATSRVAAWTLVHSRIHTFAFARDGTYEWFDFDGNVVRWDGRAPHTIGRVPGTSNRARFSPDGTRLVVFDVSYGPTWLVEVGGAQRRIGTYRDGGWSPDGRSLILYARDGGARVDRLDVESGTITMLARPEADEYSLATDGEHVWLGSMRGRIVEATSGVWRRTTHETGVMFIAMLGDSVVTASSRGPVVNPERRSDPDPVGVGMQTERSDYTIAVTSSDGGVLALRGHQAPINALAAGAGRVASGDRSGTIRVWTIPAADRVESARTGSTHAATLALGRRAIVVTKQGPALELHDLDSGRARRIAHPPNAGDGHVRVHHTSIDGVLVEEDVDGDDFEVVQLARSRDGTRLATVDSGKHAIAWDLVRATSRRVGDGVVRIAIRADGARVVTASERELLEWDTDAGTSRRLFRLENNIVEALAYSPDGSSVAFATDTRQLWLATPSLVDARDVAPEMITALAFSPDGRTLVSGDERGTVTAWDVASRAPRTLGNQDGSITHVVFASDGARVVTASSDTTLAVWSLDDRAARRVLRGHTERIVSVDFGGDDDTLLTASADRTARVWDLVTGIGRQVVAPHAIVYAGVAATGDLITVDRVATVAKHPEKRLPHDEAALRAWIARMTNVP